VEALEYLAVDGDERGCPMSRQPFVVIRLLPAV
jgi:hypothetical protein